MRSEADGPARLRRVPVDQQGAQVPAPQQLAAPLRALFDAGMTFPSFGGMGAARLAGRGSHAPHVPAPQQAIAPERALLSGAIFLPSFGGSGSGLPPGRAATGEAVGAADIAAVGWGATSVLAAAVGSAVGIAVASAVGAPVAEPLSGLFAD